MSLNSAEACSLVARSLLDAVSATNTAGATSGSGFWIDTQDLEGDLIVTQNVGSLGSTSITGKLQSATDNAGTGAADVTGATFTAVTSSSKSQTIVVPKTAITNRYLGYVGTIVGAGSNLVAVVANGAKKYI